MTTIQEVIYSLQQITRQCRQSSNRAGLFAALYLRMTQAVAQGISQNFFEDGNRMEQLDIVFAKRYLDAFESYSATGTCQPAWKITFDACKSNDLIVFQHLLLGINTHINLDLCIAAATVAPGEKIISLGTDFNRINQLIASLADDIQECLSQLWWPMRMLTSIANGKQNDVLNFSIDKARNASWANANLLAHLPAQQYEVYITQIDSITGTIAQGIIHPGWMKKVLLNTIRKMESKNITDTITLLEETVVNG